MHPQILSVLMLKQSKAKTGEAHTKGDFHIKPDEWWDAVENEEATITVSHLRLESLRTGAQCSLPEDGAHLFHLGEAILCLSPRDQP